MSAFFFKGPKHTAPSHDAVRIPGAPPAIPVTPAWANAYGDDPSALCLLEPGGGEVLGVKPPTHAGASDPRAMLPDGSIWRYVGHSGNNPAERASQVGGWLCVTLDHYTTAEETTR